MSIELKTKIKFGTDGWRAIISEDFTFENVRIVAQAIADFINLELQIPQRKKEVVVGYDTRFLSDRYAHSLSEIIAANGIRVILSSRAVPSPVVSFTVRERELCLGIMITASHNPPEFNGIKIKTHQGAAADQTVTRKIEGLLGKEKVKILSLKEAINLKRIILSDLSQPYVRFIKSYLDLARLKNKEFKVLLDCMFGSGSGYMENILRETKIRISSLHREINPSFGGRRPEPISQNLKAVSSMMGKGDFDLGLAIDGDGDRIGAMLPSGQFINAQKILALLLLHLVDDRKWSGGVVKTIAGGMLVEKIARVYRLKLYETPVGFKHISKLMLKRDVLIGGEEAGGIGLKNYIPERDGILAGLLLLEMMAYRKKGIDEILKEVERRFGRFYYLREDLPAYTKPERFEDLKLTKRILGEKVLHVKDYDGIKFICQDDSWLLLRRSGTESMVRIYAEARTQKRAKELISLGKRWINS